MRICIIVVDPLPYGKILRAAHIGMICLKMQRYFKGNDNSRCSEISRNMVILFLLGVKYVYGYNQLPPSYEQDIRKTCSIFIMHVNVSNYVVLLCVHYMRVWPN